VKRFAIHSQAYKDETGTGWEVYVEDRVAGDKALLRKKTAAAARTAAGAWITARLSDPDRQFVDTEAEIKGS